MSPVHMCECNLCLSLCVSQMVCKVDILNHMGALLWVSMVRL